MTKREPSPVGAIDDQSLFESCQDNILRGLALDMPAQYFFEKKACSWSAST